MATRHVCLNAISVHCLHGAGRGPAKCRYCGSPLHRSTGVYGVFTWTGDGRYPREAAHATYETERAAQNYANLFNHVVRWINTTD